MAKYDRIGLMAYLGKHGSRLGGNMGQYFLRWIDRDAFILSNDMVAALRDTGREVAPSPIWQKELAKVREQMNE